MDAVLVSSLLAVASKIAEAMLGWSVSEGLDHITKSDLHRDTGDAIKEAWKLWADRLEKETPRPPGTIKTSLEHGLAAMLKDKDLQQEMHDTVVEWRLDQPDPEILAKAWRKEARRPVPAGLSWDRAATYLREGIESALSTKPTFNDTLIARNLADLRQHAKGRTRFDLRKYRELLQQKYAAGLIQRTGSAKRLLDVYLPPRLREISPPAPTATLDSERAVREQPPQSPAFPRPLVEVLLCHPCRMVVLGGPGTGKTSLGGALALALLDPTGPPTWAARLGELAIRLPLVVRLRDFVAGQEISKWTDFVEHWHHLGETEGWHLTRDHVAFELEKRPCLVVFDGLDEVEESVRRQLAERICGFAHRYPLANVVVTSRPVGYDGARLGAAGFTHYSIEELDRADVDQMLDRQEPTDSNTRWRQRIDRAIETSPWMAELAANPMLLTVMARMAVDHELPSQRAELLDDAAMRLCQRWLDNPAFAQVAPPKLEFVGDLVPLLEAVAQRMFAPSQLVAHNEIGRDALVEVAAELLMRAPRSLGAEQARRAAGAMVDVMRQSNDLIWEQAPGRFGFLHRSLLEHFQAGALARQCPEGDTTFVRDLGVAHLHDPAWHEVLRALCGRVDVRAARALVRYLVQCSAVQRVIPHLGDAPALELAAGCLVELRLRKNDPLYEAFARLLLPLPRSWVGASPPLATYAACVRVMRKQWEGKDRLRAVLERCLLRPSGTGTAIALRCVEEWTPVAERVDWLRKLADRGHRGWIRTEAIERLASLDLGFCKARLDAWLDSPDAGVRRAAVGLVAQARREAPVPTLERAALRDGSSSVRESAVQALAEVDAAACAEVAMRLLREEQDAGVLRAAARVLAPRVGSDPAALDALTRCLSHEDAWVQSAAVGALAEGNGGDALLKAAAQNADTPMAAQRAIVALARRKGREPRVEELVRRLLSTGSPNQQKGALEALARHILDDGDAFELLLEHAELETDDWLPSVAAELLTEMFPRRPETLGAVRRVVERDIVNAQITLEQLAHLSPEQAAEVTRQRLDLGQTVSVSPFARGCSDPALRRERLLHWIHTHSNWAVVQQALGWLVWSEASPERVRADLEALLDPSPIQAPAFTPAQLARNMSRYTAHSILAYLDDPRPLAMLERQARIENSPPSFVLDALAWTDEPSTRDALVDACRHAPHEWTRRSALHALTGAVTLPPEEMVALAIDRFVHDDGERVRLGAADDLLDCFRNQAGVRATFLTHFDSALDDVRPHLPTRLAAAYPEDPDIHALLRSSCADPDEDVRRTCFGALLSTLAGLGHSALQVFSVEGTGDAPFHDPQTPLGPDQLEAIAAKLGRSMDEVSRVVSQASHALNLSLLAP